MAYQLTLFQTKKYVCFGRPSNNQRDVCCSAQVTIQQGGNFSQRTLFQGAAGPWRNLATRRQRNGASISGQASSPFQLGPLLSEGAFAAWRWCLSSKSTVFPGEGRHQNTYKSGSAWVSTGFCEISAATQHNVPSSTWQGLLLHTLDGSLYEGHVQWFLALYMGTLLSCSIPFVAQKLTPCCSLSLNASRDVDPTLDLVLFTR